MSSRAYGRTVRLESSSIVSEGEKRCPRCQQDKVLSQFDRGRSGKPASYCKACLSLYCRQHYVANAAAHNRRRAGNQRRYSARNQKFVQQFLREHPCVDCGQTNPLFLEFDHAVLGEKLDAVSTLAAAGRGLEIIQREIARCEVRCIICHRRRTARQFGWTKRIHPSSGV